MYKLKSWRCWTAASSTCAQLFVQVKVLGNDQANLQAFSPLC